MKKSMFHTTYLKGRLPEEILVSIFMYLDYNNRVTVSMVNKAWNKCFNASSLWQYVPITFKNENDRKYLNIAVRFGSYIKSLHIRCYQRSDENCNNVCRFAKRLLLCHELYLENFSLSFCEANPIFFSADFTVTSLENLFLHQGLKSLKSLDLSQFTIPVSDKLIDVITENHARHIEMLNVQTKVLAHRITSTSILNLIKYAEKLRYLYIPANCFSGEVADMLLRNCQINLKHVSLSFTGVHKNIDFPGNEDWIDIKTALPKLTIEFKFDQTYSENWMLKNMQPNVPVSKLQLLSCLHTHSARNILQRVTYFKDTLHTLVINNTSSKEFEELLLDLITECINLKRIYINCVISERTAQMIRNIEHFENVTLFTVSG